MLEQHQSTTIRNDVTVMSDGQAAGCIAYWQLEGRVPATELLAALADVSGVAENVPHLATNAEILRRAVRAVAGRRDGVFVDKHRNGFNLVQREDLQGVEFVDLPSYEGKLIVRLDDTDEDRVVFSSTDHPLRAEIEREFNARLGHFETTEISVWLTKLLDDCKAVRMRPRGGFYYVTNSMLPKFRAAVMALRTCSSSEVFEIPAMSSRETAAAIISALRLEVEAATKTARDFTSSGAGGKRACQTQLDNLVAVKDKLQLYAEFMDGELDGVVDALDNAKVTIAQTLLEKQ